MEDNKDSITNPLHELAIGMAASANSTVSTSSPRSHSSGRREDRLNRFPLIGQKVYVHPRRDKQGNVRMDLPTLPIRRAESKKKRGEGGEVESGRQAKKRRKAEKRAERRKEKEREQRLTQEATLAEDTVDIK